MKLSRSIDLAHQSKQKTADINITSPSNKSNKYSKNNSRNIKKQSNEKKRKIFSHNSFNDEEYTHSNNNETNITSQNIKKHNSKRVKSRNSKLTPAKYIKPLFYILTNQIKPIYKQFKGYRNEKYFINFNYNLFTSFKNGEINMIKTISNNDNNLYQKNKRKMHNRSFDDNLRNKKYNCYFNSSQEENEILNSKTKLLQAYMKGFISRLKFFNELKNNSKNKNVKYSETITKLMNSFFEKLNSIKSKFNINNKLTEHKNISFTIKRKQKNRKTLNNNNLYLIQQQNEELKKEKDLYLKEKKMHELRIGELTEENNKLRKKNNLAEKCKLNYDKLKEENESLNQKINELEERNKELDMLEIKCKNLQDQNESLYQENLKLNNQIEEKINNLMEINKKNQEKIKLYEKTMLDQESVINENKTLNELNNDYKNRMKQLLEENNSIKEQLKEKENNSKKNNKNEKPEEQIKKENIKLLSENKAINQKNEELQIQLDEIKKRLKKIQKQNKFANKFVNENSNSQSGEKSNISTPYEQNEDFEKEKENNNNDNHELYLKRVQERRFLTDEQINKQKKMENILKRRITEMKDDLHRCFMRFYYNGIFIQQQKRNIMKEPITKVVKSKRFSALISKFSGGILNKDETVDIRNDKRRQTKSYDEKINNNLKVKNSIEEDEKEK